MESPLGAKKDAAENTGIDSVNKLQEKADETDAVNDQENAAKTEIKGIKNEDNGPGLEKKIDSLHTDIRKDIENNVNNGTIPDIIHSNKEKVVPASDEMEPALPHVEQNNKELIHSTL